MKKSRLNRRKYQRRNKFIIITSLFIVCILFAGIGIKFTLRAKASSENQNTLQKVPVSTTNNQSIQHNNTAKNKADKPPAVQNTVSSNNSAGNNAPSSKNAGNNPVPPANTSSTDKGSEAPTPDNEEVPNKVAYLTFDDGPSVNVTPKVLDILKQENVQATFFVIGSMCEENPELLKREKAEGHSIGNHTYSHEYNIVYSSPENFIKDIKKSQDVITKIIGTHDTSLIRFPGGSFGRHSYKDAVSKAGYRYIDWNCLTGDAEVSRASVDRLLLRFNETMGNQDKLIILMHDAPYKTTTPEALPQIIKILKDKGYTFKGL
ncbi:polysaccharide deacetylase family protein [Clostridium pasteurianum DSM 525 = ATCC 6013]|uniref:Polysaccharide deacetylase n=1 Tax=Clostridium pasteurianum DSM 525 = ATCC 6013 TaxID=1262449 RepID=A0A0H3IYP4_CLOPA|nr:polysaccharide deacetylase family protein [Clostridium pasteurianum]AJA46631.1 polysaccharide deacetylase family protein [Clostridium pasteurianum DSM 525 = ATCC 6013]AJA50619.1 polysaccharide deacetylase family protein [Clostridium pasteurianum DSM 525 = ATCC 6013]AOZ74044.1 polysaccharide deacetylase [Clostridium pasteurianum DSM 525 = ATCC 6013]AOZ77841.1 polysaccharide deacetylase [Clostridium pasteurianum]ELP61197.1 polysaccharide deacetylase family protein [Clostridium pasteurianum DS